MAGTKRVDVALELKEEQRKEALLTIKIMSQAVEDCYTSIETRNTYGTIRCWFKN